MILEKGESTLVWKLKINWGKDSSIGCSQEGMEDVSVLLICPLLVFPPQNAENVFIMLMQNDICQKHVYQFIGSV